MDTQKLKICYLGDATSPHIAFWAQNFVNRGHQVFVISPNPAEINGVKVYSTKTKHHKSINFFLTYGIIKKLIKKIKPDVIHAHYLGTFSFLASLTGFHPFIGTVWGSDIDMFGTRNYFTKYMLKHILNKADFIETPDKTTKEFLVRKYKIKEQKVDFPYWGIKTTEFEPLKIKKSIDIAYLRKSSEKYSTDTFVQAMNLIKKEIPEFNSILIRKEGYAKVENMIKKYNLDKNINTLKWANHNEMPLLLNSSLIYVDSFHRNVPGGGMGITAMEAMSCGLPVVLANNPGVSDYVKHDYNGLLYDGGNYKQLAECVIKLLKNKKLRDRLGKNARKTVIEELNWEKISKKMEDKYYELLDRHDF